MPEIGSSGLMSGDGKRGVGHRPQATAPILDFTTTDSGHLRGKLRGYGRSAVWSSLGRARAYTECLQHFHVSSD